MPQDRLDSWKEIAGYLQRDIKTVRRWEKSLGLPIHRLQREKLDAVFALKSEIDAWQEARTLRRNLTPFAVTPARPNSLEEDPTPGTPLKAGQKRRSTLMRIGIGIAVLAVLGGAAWITHRPEIGIKQPAFRYVVEGRDHLVRAAAVSPNGRKVAYASEENTVYFRDFESQQSEAIALPEAERVDLLAWLTDSSAVLASAHSVPDNKPAIWKVSIGRSPAALLVDDARNGVPSPDGAKVGYTDGKSSEIWILKDGQAQRVVRPFASDTLRALVWSPDGRRLSYQRLEPQPSYESTDIVSGAITAKTADIRMDYACGLRDGRILFSGLEYGGQAGIWEVKTDLRTGALASEFARIQDETTEGGLSATTDGMRLMGVSERNRADLGIASLEGPVPHLANIRNLTANQESVTNYPQAWTADSTEVIFASNRFNALDLFRQRLDDLSPKTIVHNAERKFLPQLSPDGRAVLYASRAREGAQLTSLWRVSLKGGAPEQVPIGEPLDEFRCATQPGRRCVLRTSEPDHYVFWELDPLRGKSYELARTARASNLLGDWALSPDGLEVVIPIHAAAEARLRVVTLAGGGEREVTLAGLAALRGVHWAADGKGWFVAVQKSHYTSLYYADLAGNAHLLRDETDLSWAVPSPDGRLLAFVEYSKARSGWVFDRN